MIDSFKHKGLRKKLVETLVLKGIKDQKVLAAIHKIPRHWFLDSAISEHAYQDKALAIGAGQTISQPYTVAFQTQLLRVSPGKKILEIGTGSGYQGSVLCELGAAVYSIERIATLSASAQQMFAKLGYAPSLKVGDGSLGWPEKAPFDGIIVTAAAPNLAESLYKQLKPGGHLVIPVGKDVQTMYRITKGKDGKPIKEKFSDFRFVPLIGAQGFNE